MWFLIITSFCQSFGSYLAFSRYTEIRKLVATFQVMSIISYCYVVCCALLVVFNCIGALSMLPAAKPYFDKVGLDPTDLLLIISAGVTSLFLEFSVVLLYQFSLHGLALLDFVFTLLSWLLDRLQFNPVFNISLSCLVGHAASALVLLVFLPKAKAMAPVKQQKNRRRPREEDFDNEMNF